MPGQASILEANKNTAGSGLVKGNSCDSGNIVTVGTPGKPPQRQTYGAQEQATNPIVCAPNANFVLNPTGPGQNSGDKATITNSTITSSFVAGVPQVVVTVLAVNDFIAGQTVKFASLVNGSAVNELCGVVQSAGLSGTGFEAIITNFVPLSVNGVAQALPTAGSASDSGSAAVSYASRTACLSQKSNE
jgi:hypothetical protein